MSDRFFSEKALPALDLVALTATVPDERGIDPVMGPMFWRLFAAWQEAGFDADEPAYAWYQDGAEGLAIGVGLKAAPDVTVPETTRVTLTAQPRAFATIHHGKLAGITATWDALRAHVTSLDLTPIGPCREFYMATPRSPGDDWIIELQQPMSA